MTLTVGAGYTARSQENDCASNVAAAFRRHLGVDLADSAIVRREIVMTVVPWRGTAGIDSSTSELETYTFRGGSGIVGPGYQIWNDFGYTVRVNALDSVITITDRREHRRLAVAQERFNAIFGDSIVAHSTLLTCEPARGMRGARHVEFAVDTAMWRFFNVRSFSVDLSPTGDIVRFSIDHPASGAVRSTRYDVRKIEVVARAGSDKSILDRFLDQEGQPLPAWFGYRFSRDE